MKFFIILLIIAIVCKATVYDDFTKGGGVCHAVNAQAQVLLGMVGDDADACTSMSTAPGNYIQMDFVGLNYVNESNQKDSHVVVELTGDGALEADIQEPSGRKGEPQHRLAYAAIGSTLSDNGRGGYISYHSLLMMEGEEVEFNKTKFKYMDGYVTDVCVGKVDFENDHENDGCSTVEMRKASPGFYKFSLYGQTGGDSYKAFADQHTHMGFRQQMDLSQMGDYTISFNDNRSLDLSSMKENINMKEKTAIKSMQIRVAGSPQFSMGYDFEDNLTFGKVSDGELVEDRVDGWKMYYRTTPTGNKDVEIFVQQTETDDIYTIDYVFKIKDTILQEGGSYFAYDPSVHGLADEDDSDEDSSMILSAFIAVICLVLL